MDCTNFVGFFKCFAAANLIYAALGLGLVLAGTVFLAVYAFGYFTKEKKLLKKFGAFKVTEYRYASVATYRAQIEKLVAAGHDVSDELVTSSADGYLYVKFLGQKPQDVGLMHPGNKVAVIFASQATHNIILNVCGFYLPAGLLEKVDAPAAN